MQKDKIEHDIALAFGEVLKHHNIKLRSIASIEQNCGTIWVMLYNGKMYSLSPMECEE